MPNSDLPDSINGQIIAVRMGSPMQLKKEPDRYDIALDISIKCYLATLAFDEESPNQLCSAEQKRSRAEFEIKSLLEKSDLGGHILAAIQTLMDDGKKYLSMDVYEAMKTNFNDAKTSLEKLDLETLLEKNFDQILGLNADTINSIFKMGVAKYEEGHHQISLSLFVLLTILQPYDFDLWYRTAIIAQQCENFDLALRAYTETIELNNGFAEAPLFSAECYLKKALHSEAKAAYQQAEKVIEASLPVKEEIRELLDHLKNMVQ